MKRVYVAGAYSADSTMGTLHNIRKGIRASTEIFLMGYAPFCPWLDFQFVLMLREGEQLYINQFYQYSFAWLKAYAPEELKLRKPPFSCNCYPECPIAPSYCPSCSGNLCL